MQQIMKQAQQMQQQLERAQAELTQREFVGTAGGGVVKATVNGRPELVSIEISPEVVDPDDIEMLQDLVVAAVRQALDSASEAANSELGGLTGGLGGLLG